MPRARGLLDVNSMNALYRSLYSAGSLVARLPSNMLAFIRVTDNSSRGVQQPGATFIAVNFGIALYRAELAERSIKAIKTVTG